MTTKCKVGDNETILLDSSLISKYLMSNSCQLGQYSKIDKYSIKLINCGDYIQVYYFDNYNTRLSDDFKDNREYEKLKRKHKLKDFQDLDTEDLSKTKYADNLRTISYLNASRSRFNCQRLAKCNMKEWNTFITLTFADSDTMDISDIPSCNKVFNSWVSNIRKLKPDLKYLAVPEIQKRRGEKYGVYAIHYHLLSNLGKADIPTIIYQQKDFTDNQLKTMSDVERSKCYNIKYWNKGYVRVDFVTGDCKKITGYISKYMTKDIDNKFFGKKRYFFSQNLIKPITSYLDLADSRSKEYFYQLLSDYNPDFISRYNDKNNNLIEYIEFKKK